ncbi:hypothetical protein ACSQ67_016088 [Phaseolus vulgaris]
MFPRGASAYIDDIGKLINLKDGSIRTAIDTGCGVRAFLNRMRLKRILGAYEAKVGELKVWKKGLKTANVDLVESSLLGYNESFKKAMHQALFLALMSTTRILTWTRTL